MSAPARIPAAPPSGPRRRRWPYVVAGLALLPVAGLAVLAATFDAEALKPRIAAAVAEATGRELVLAGPIGLRPSLVPTLALSDVALANAPGGSRPHMLTVRRIEVELALLPLLSRRVEVRRLLLDGPDLLLETDAAGAGNWRFAPPAAPGAAPRPEAAREAGRRLGLAVDAVRVVDGRIAWRPREGEARTLAIRALETRSTSAEAPVAFDGVLEVGGLAVAVAGRTGSLAVLTAPSPTPWPVGATLRAAGAELALEGALARPLEGRGWRFALRGAAPDLAALSPLAPAALPPLRAVTLAGTVAEGAGEGAWPAVADLAASAGESDLSAWAPGLVLRRAELALAALDQPLRVAGEVVSGGLPLRFGATLGAPVLLRPSDRPNARRTPYPVDASLEGEGVAAGVSGRVANPADLTGIDVGFTVRAADLSALALLARRPLPALRDVTLTGRLTERGAAFAQGGRLRDLSVLTSAGDAAGELSWAPSPRPGRPPGVVGRLASRRLDLDALRAAMPDAPAAPTPGVAAPAAPARPADRRVIPDLPIPVAALRAADADLRWTIGELVAGGRALRDVTAWLAVEEGRARLDPFAFALPGEGRGDASPGRLTLRLAADAAAEPPALQVAARSEGAGLDLAALLPLLGAPGRVEGRAEIDLDLRGRGAGLRDAAADAAGHVGLAVGPARIDARALDALAGPLRQFAPDLAREGAVAIRCAALRLDLAGGIARPQAFLVDTALLRLTGSGAASLRDETLDLRLLPNLRLGRAGLAVPVLVGGTFRAPALRGDPRGGAAAAAGIAAELLARQGEAGNPLAGIARGLLGTAPGADGPDCVASLALARGGGPGPVPAPEAVPAAPAVPAPGAAPAVPGVPPALQGPAQELLRGLLGGRR